MNRSDFNLKISNVFSDKIDFDLQDIQCNAFFDFMNMLIEKNKVMNLTTIVEPEEIIMKHFLDSCMAIKFFDDFSGKKIIDIGTGAGFPGIPLSIICKDTEFLLSDTLGKRINFLNEVKDTIGLKNVKLVKARAEDLAQDKGYREKFDYVLSRGVANLSVLAEYSLPFAKIGGKMLAYKMDDCNAELEGSKKAINTLGGMFHVKHSYEIYQNEPKRSILEILKEKPTPKKFPRKAGTPSKKPL